ncbi:MAG: hypothetical protein IJU76_05800 [Desulfovibrionaceae bacterium]|nr:hypothetical protein [Desulfovibrionaceae bacterium]
MKAIVSLCAAFLVAALASFAQAFDCPLGSAVIEPGEQLNGKTDGAHTSSVPIPIQGYQCVKYDKVHKKWIAYRGSAVYAFPAGTVRVWRVDGELFVNANDQVLLRPRKPFLIKGNSPTGVVKDSIQFNAKEKVWVTHVRDTESGVKDAGGDFPEAEYDAYDGNGLAIPGK